MNKFFLWLAMLPSGLWRSMGADTDQLKAILGVKLKLDDRKPVSFGRRQQNKKHKYSSFMSMLISFFMGFIYIFPLLAFRDVVFSMFAFFTVFLFILTFSLITDFSNVLIDTKDKFIILPRPVNDKTLMLSRLLHVFIYLFRVVLPMSLPGWIVLGLDRGAAAATIFPIPLILMVCLALFFVNAAYTLILRLAKPGSFRKVLDSFQVIFTIVVIGCYYLLQATMKSPALKNLDPANYGWVRFTPPYWLASFWAWLGFETSFSGVKWLAILAIVLPLLGLWATIKWLAPHFNRKIAEMDGLEVTETNSRPANGKASKSKTRYLQLSEMLNKADAAKAGFIITWLQTTRSRTFRMRVYPALAYVPMYFFYILLMDERPFTTVWQALPNTKSHLFLLYMSAFAMLQALNYVNMSDQFKAAWVYYASPLKTPGQVLGGAFKALWIKYYLPFITLIGVFVIWVWGAGAILDIILAMANVTMYTLCIMRVMHRNFPFSVPDQVKTGGFKGFMRSLSTIFLMFFLGFGHYIASIFLWLKVLFLVLTLIFLWLVWDSIRNTSWENIRKAE
jgi:ABC-2 type transport system permease protein